MRQEAVDDHADAGAAGADVWQYPPAVVHLQRSPAIGDAPVQVGGDGRLRRVQVRRIGGALVQPDEQQPLPRGAAQQPGRPFPVVPAPQGPVRDDPGGLQAGVDQ